MKYKSNGKILLTSEYLVLDGALALALPSKLSQNLEVKYTENKKCLKKCSLAENLKSARNPSNSS